MFRDKKGQAAMEFLMTYGWAILAAIIAIGVLAYFYFSPGDMAANAAVINAPFYAEAWNVQTSQMQLGVKNNGQDTVTVTEISVIGNNGDFNCSTGALTEDISSGETYDAALSTCDGSGTAGDSYKGDITVKYTRGDSTVELTSTGSVSSTVVA